VKVLHVAPNISRAYGGPTYSLAAYSRASLATGFELTIAAPRPNSEDQWLAGMLPNVDLRTFSNIGRGAFVASPALHAWLRHNGSRFDVVHVHGLLNPVSSLTARTCIGRGWPLVVRPFGTMSRYTFAHRRGTIKRAYSAILDRRNLCRAQAVHFTTDVERDESTWQGITWDGRAFVVPPPWLTVAGYDTRESRAHRRTVLFLSRLHPVKNVELLLDAWPLVQRGSPDAQLMIAGDGDLAYVSELRVRAERLGGSVNFLGYAEGVAKRKLLADADLFVLPSLHENFGIAVLEAVASGLPVVVTPEVQLSHFIKEHSLGLVSQRSPEGLAHAIMDALGDDELNARCRDQGAALVTQHFSLQTVGEQLLEMYRFAVSHPPA
jgi:glycosyltransferase involved in cell wall biosynthesis